ncbi:MAG: PepSY domain-containing protein [Azospirillaceae bacterium]|nr:PepSY domain-containing protein [Azospirillaceae bacterium]
MQSKFSQRMLPPAVLTLAALTLGLMTSLPARAENAVDCGNAPRAQWLSTDAIKAKGIALGYDVRRVKVEKGCYELYAIDKAGARVELVLNPVTGAVAGTEGED